MNTVERKDIKALKPQLVVGVFTNTYKSLYTALNTFGFEAEVIEKAQRETLLKLK